MIENGGQGRNRTADASLFRAALYQLSYLATSTSAIGKSRKPPPERCTEGVLQGSSACGIPTIITKRFEELYAFAYRYYLASRAH